MPDFHQTPMGSKFYNSHVPTLIRQLTRIADALEELVDLQTQQTTQEPLVVSEVTDWCGTRAVTEEFEGSYDEADDEPI